MADVRAFVAMNLPVELVQKVVDLQHELRGKAEEAGVKLRWVPGPNIHLTLRFLGGVPEETLWAVGRRVGERLASLPPVPLTVRGTGAFPGPERPRVLWVGIHPESEALGAVYAAVEEGLEAMGFEREQRPFHPHLTLARVKHGTGDLLAGTEDTELGRCTVSEVVLYESRLHRKGAEYVARARMPLAGEVARPGAPTAAERDGAAGEAPGLIRQNLPRP